MFLLKWEGGKCLRDIRKVTLCEASSSSGILQYFYDG